MSYSRIEIPMLFEVKGVELQLEYVTCVYVEPYTNDLEESHFINFKYNGRKVSKRLANHITSMYEDYINETLANEGIY